MIDRRGALADDEGILSAETWGRPFGWGRAAVYRRAQLGQIPHLRVGRRVYFTRQGQLEFLRLAAVMPNVVAAGEIA